MNIATILQMGAAGDPDRTVASDGEQSLTFSELGERADLFVSLLGEVKPRAVMYLGGNDVRFAVALFGSSLAAVPLMPLNYRLAPDQLRLAIRDLRPSLLIADERNHDVATQLGADVTMSLERLDARLESSQPSSLTAPPSDGDAVAILLLTSGTTGTPKKVVLRQRHLFSYVVSTCEFLSAAASEATLVTVPPYHIAGVANLLSSLYSGRCVIYLQDFSAGGWLDVVEQRGVTHAMVVPTMLSRIVGELERTGAAGPDSLRAISYGGAKAPRPLVERALRLLPEVDFVNAYGLTETSSTIAVLTPEDHRLAATDARASGRLGSVGRVVPGVEVEIRDVVDSERGLGTVWVRGSHVSGEYLEGGQRSDDDGWFCTRDLGWLDDDGYLFIHGRRDDTIIRGGENIAPTEIEEVIARHPAVHDVAAFGVPDEEWGQQIALAVVADRDQVTPEELRTFARQQLRASRTPRYVYFMDDLPRTDTGKLLRRVLAHELGADGPDQGPDTDLPRAS